MSNIVAFAEEPTRCEVVRERHVAVGLGAAMSFGWVRLKCTTPLGSEFRGVAFVPGIGVGSGICTVESHHEAPHHEAPPTEMARPPSTFFLGERRMHVPFFMGFGTCTHTDDGLLFSARGATVGLGAFSIRGLPMGMFFESAPPSTVGRLAALLGMGPDRSSR